MIDNHVQYVLQKILSAIINLCWLGSISYGFLSYKYKVSYKGKVQRKCFGSSSKAKVEIVTMPPVLSVRRVQYYRLKVMLVNSSSKS